MRAAMFSLSRSLALSSLFQNFGYSTAQLSCQVFWNPRLRALSTVQYANSRSKKATNPLILSTERKLDSGMQHR